MSLLDPPDAPLGRGRLPQRRGLPGPGRRRRRRAVVADHPLRPSRGGPESPGDLYDATEIDEILALRVLTLTDEEKSEARGTDPERPPSSTAATTCHPEMWDRCTARCALDQPDHDGDESPVPWAEPDASGTARPTVPWWDPAADASVDPWAELGLGRRRRGREGHAGYVSTLAPLGRPGPVPRAAWTPPWPASSAT